MPVSNAKCGLTLLLPDVLKPVLSHCFLASGAGQSPRMERSRSILLLDVYLLGYC